MRYCKKCGAALNDEMLFCQKCGTKCDAEQPKAAYAVLEDVDINTPAPKKNKSSQGSRTVAAVIAIFLIVVLVIILGVKGCSTNPIGNEDQSSQSAVKSGEDYEGDVFTAFWEGASKSFGVEYGDYKFAHTSYSWIDDFTTTDGYTAHYYLIQTAFETKNTFGQKVLHPVTARCYYVPEYSNTVYTTYMTLDGETVLFDEEKENWLMGMGGGKASTTNSENTDNKKDETVSTNSSNQNDKSTQNNTNSTKPNESGNNTTKPNQSQTNTENVTQHTCSYSDWEYYSQGQHQRYCTSCYETENANHKWDSGKVSKQATCAEEGEKVFTCTDCGGTKSEAIAKLSHNFTEKVESSKYLKSNATFNSGTTYYFSCVCGEKGTETFSLNDRKEWISAEELQNKYGYGYAWMGEYIWLGRTDWDTNTRYDYQIYGSPPSRMESGVIYQGDCNGTTVRFKSEPSNTVGSGLFFNYNDLVSAGII